MQYRVDLHIHSCLSPCADDDMTPWNIVGMAKLKGLDAIAVCDHNSAKNLPAVCRAGEEYGVCILPGLEVTSREDVHLLCYFQTLEEALSMGERVAAHQPRIKNKPSLFGRQILVNDEDDFVGEEERLLLTASDLSISDIAEMTWDLKGIMVPAHINKGANSLIPILGMMPLDVILPTVEIFKMRPHSALGKLCIHSSDAHQLMSINEAQEACVLELPQLSAAALVMAFRQGQVDGGSFSERDFSTHT